MVIGEGLCVYALVQVAYELEWRTKGLDENQLAACLLQVLVLRCRIHLVDNSEERAVCGQ